MQPGCKLDLAARERRDAAHRLAHQVGEAVPVEVRHDQPLAAPRAPRLDRGEPGEVAVHAGVADRDAGALPARIAECQGRADADRASRDDRHPLVQWIRLRGTHLAAPVSPELHIVDDLGLARHRDPHRSAEVHVPAFLVGRILPVPHPRDRYRRAAGREQVHEAVAVGVAVEILHDLAAGLDEQRVGSLGREAHVELWMRLAGAEAAQHRRRWARPVVTGVKLPFDLLVGEAHVQRRRELLVAARLALEIDRHAVLAARSEVADREPALHRIVGHCAVALGGREHAVAEGALLAPPVQGRERDARHTQVP